MKLAIMTKSTFFVEEDKILATLFDEGMENLQLYKPGASPLYSERLLTLLPEESHRNIWVHDHYYLKSEFDLAGIHVDDPQEETPKGYRGRIGRTCTDLSTLKEIKKQSNYVFLKNIFDCIEFKDERQSFTLSQLEEASQKGLIDKKVYALGGLGLENIHIVKELGFGGVVICGDLWNHFDIHNETDYRGLIDRFVKLRKACD
ncbi:MAG: thiamine phosphate synthase [Prevotella sp.]|jgi:thiamine-phosphate pyrophosphorylase|nr:thiamine phosphate synthase [Prevotella sp.]MCI2080347.1 thiamine phosphate synthase [Prevotella sp.]MCI2102182.1 thiamine phosphate synthase [Prevotella sp.]